ncbi:hypothetical protein [Nannocystis sp. SCPEA4]|uniref:hypothetical protein n=1 Tax=Nannocystis sp. SCPEA4 TaxID=2996787 RepID=UPI002270A38C|nr:hypothetical protein [Nannocystis sp. SCPEA4]MCY1054871.1 hypothetical protein [Nannocystis sp. SCPEA4]
MRWSDFFCPDEARAADVVLALAARLRDDSTGEVREFNEMLDAARFGGDGTRPGHITSPVPLIHPRLREPIAAHLGLTASEVAAVARYDTCLRDGAAVPFEQLRDLDSDEIVDTGGGAAIEHLLLARTGRADLVLDRIPVLPPRERRPVVSDAGEPVPGPIDRAYERLLAALALYRRYVELNAPAVMRMAQWERVQDGFAALCAAVAGEPDPHALPFALDDAWLEQCAADLAHSRSEPAHAPIYLAHLQAALRPAPPEPPLPRHGHHVDPLTPLVCRFVGEDALLLVLPHAVAVIDATSGECRFVTPAPTSDIVAVTPEGDHAVFVARGDLLARVYALDLRRGVWLDAWDSLTPPPFPMGPYKSDAWCLYDYGRRLARPLPEAGNFKAGAVLSPCLRHAWIEGTTRIFRTTDFLPQFDCAALPRSTPLALALWRRGEQPPDVDGHDDGVYPHSRQSTDVAGREDDEYEDDEYDDIDPRVAFALAADGFRVFWGGALYVRREPTLRIDHPFTSVTLDRTGERLLVAYPGELVLHSLAADGRPADARRLSLAGLAGEVTLSAFRERVPGLDRDVEMQLLAHFSTVAALRRASADELARADGFPPMLEPEYTPLDAELVREIHAALQAG